MNAFEKWAISMLLCFTAGAAIAHANTQPMHNATNALESQIQFLMERKVVGFLIWNDQQRVWRYVEKGRCQ